MSLRRRLLLFIGLLPAGLPAADVGVVTVTDMTSAGRKLTPPSREAPAYYQAITVGFQSFQRAIAGDREPPNDAFLQLILRTLREQGYEPSTEQHHPTLVLGFAWGYLSGNFGAALQFMGGEKLDLMWEVEQQMGPNLDPRVLLRNLRSGMADRVMDLARDPLYVVVIAAYDREQVLQGNLELLWQTRMAAPAIGSWAMDALPQVVRAGGPSIGRETTLPQWLGPAEVRGRTSVEIGELETVETFELERLPLIDLTKEPAEAR